MWEAGILRLYENNKKPNKISTNKLNKMNVIRLLCEKKKNIKEIKDQCQNPAKVM